MKAKLLITVLTFLSVSALVSVTVSSCKKSNNSTHCSNSGTAINIGSTTGGNFSQDVVTNLPYLICGTDTVTVSISGNAYVHNDYISFDNTTSNFSVSDDCGLGCYGLIMDVGSKSCANFSYSGTITASVVAYKSGHGYVGIFPDGHS